MDTQLVGLTEKTKIEGVFHLSMYLKTVLHRLASILYSCTNRVLFQAYLYEICGQDYESSN